MLSLRSRKLALTLFCTLALALALLEPAQALEPLAVNRRDHANLNRMIKKRSPGLLDDINPINNAGTGATSDDTTTGNDAGSAQAADASSTAASSAASSSATSQAASSTASSSEAASSTTPATSESATSSVASSTTSSSVSSTASSTASSTETSSTASSTPASSAPPASSAAPSASAPGTQTTPNAVAAQDKGSPEAVTITSHISATATPTSSPAAKAAASSSSLSKGAITTLAVIAGCIGGGALIWTIFRKWKLRTSKRFDDRLAPIDWQPPTENDDVPGSNRRASIASSFHSAGHDGLVRANSSASSSQTYGAYGATSQHAPTLQPLPEHDFTAGPQMGYLGANAGYADLARGPSPGPRGPSPSPQMQDLNRGPSFNHGYNGYPQQQAPAGAYDYSTPHY